MPSEQVVSQQIQAAEPMSADAGAVEVQQPKVAPEMSTESEEVRMRGGEYASCDFCGCGCSEGCC